MSIRLALSIIFVVIIAGLGAWWVWPNELTSHASKSPVDTEEAITILSPKGGETFKAGEPITIRWEGGGGVAGPADDIGVPDNSVDISLSEDPAQAGTCIPKGAEQPIAGEAEGGVLTLSGHDTLKLTQGATCRFKVRIASAITSASAESGYFTITP
jgi:hypothetical protein